MEKVEITVRGVTYHINAEVWRVAVRTFEQQYSKFTWISVPTLAAHIAEELMPATHEDPFSGERLKRCLLSHFGKRGGRRASLPQQPEQLSLFEEVE